MPRYSFIVMERVSAFPSPEAFRRALQALRDCGYEGVELNLTEPLGVDLDLLEKWTRELQLQVPSFLTGEAYFEGLCLSSPDPEIRGSAVERLIRYLDVAERFGSILGVGLLQGLRRDEPNAAVANTRIQEGLCRFADAAEKRQIDIVLEPVNHLQVGFNNSVAEVRAMVTAVNSPRLRPMVDTLHMNIEESSLRRPILDCGKALRQVHLCESNGGAFGSGRVNFVEALAALHEIGYSGFASVKVYRHLDFETAARSSIEYLRRTEAEVDALPR